MEYVPGKDWDEVNLCYKSELDEDDDLDYDGI